VSREEREEEAEEEKERGNGIVVFKMRKGKEPRRHIYKQTKNTGKGAGSE